MGSLDIHRALFAHSDWARDKLMGLAKDLDNEALDRAFEMGLGSLRATLYHLWAVERVCSTGGWKSPPRRWPSRSGAWPSPSCGNGLAARPTNATGCSISSERKGSHEGLPTRTPRERIGPTPSVTGSCTSATTACTTGLTPAIRTDILHFCARVLASLAQSRRAVWRSRLALGPGRLGRARLQDILATRPRECRFGAFES